MQKINQSETLESYIIGMEFCMAKHRCLLSGEELFMQRETEAYDIYFFNLLLLKIETLRTVTRVSRMKRSSD